MMNHSCSRPSLPAGPCFVAVLIASVAGPIGLAAPADAAVWVADATLHTGGGDIGLTVTIDDVAAQIEFVLAGPDAVWFAVGLGNDTMDSTYTLLTYPDGTVEERRLGADNPGDPVTPTVQLESWSAPGDGTATFTLTRALDPGAPDGYVFPMVDVEAGNPIPIIWARGNGAELNYHGPMNRATGDVSFDPGGPVGVDEPGIVATSWGRSKLRFRSRQ